MLRDAGSSLHQLPPNGAHQRVAAHLQSLDMAETPRGKDCKLIEEVTYSSVQVHSIGVVGLGHHRP